MRLTRRLSGPVLALSLGAGLLVALPGGAAYAVDPVAGAQTSGDVLFPNVGNGGYDVQHYDIDLAWTPGATLAASTIEATTSIEAVTTGAPLSSYSLDLEGLDVASVTVDGQPAGFTRVEDTDAIKHKLVVTPAAPVSGAFTTTVTYSGVPRAHRDADGSLEGWNVTADGATFLNQPVGAMTGFPNNNTPDDKATYTLALDVPTTITNLAGAGAAAAVSNGELVSRVPDADGGRTTWTWDQREQMATSLVLVSIGKYDVLQSEITLAGGRTLPEWSFVDSAIPAAAKDTIATRRASIEAITDGLKTLFGPYPGNSTGIVVDLVPRGINYALETQDRSFFPGSVSADTLVHELAHQWFGNTVSPRVWNDIWIAEGMGTWAPTYYNNAISGTSTESTESVFFTSWNDAAADDELWTVPPGAMTDSAVLYGDQTYVRSGQMYEALRTAIGDPAFFAFLRAWPTRYAGQSRGAADFEALAEEISGRDLTTFFQDWIFEPGKPAWPATFDLRLSATPATASVDPGQIVTYTASTTNTGRVVQDGSVVTLDVSDVLDDARIDPAGLPAGVSLAGGVLTWRVPTTELAGTQSVSLTAVVRAEATSAGLRATARAATLGGTCVACSTTVSVAPQPAARFAGGLTERGRNRVGRKLRVVAPSVQPGTTLTYTWTVRGRTVKSSGTPRLLVRQRYVGKRVRVVATATRPGAIPATARAGFGRVR